MSKYNLSKIMKRAWELVKRVGLSISEALKKSWKVEKGMDVQELVKKYEITLWRDGKIRVNNVVLLKKDGVEEIIRRSKPEIMAFLEEKEAIKKRAYQDRQEKINSIEGLAEIRESIRRQNEWKERFERSWARGDGFVGLGEKPEDNISELKQKYPRAAAYLVAENESLKSNYELSLIGKKALEAIINGENYKEVMNRMENEKEAFVNHHLWD